VELIGTVVRLQVQRSRLKPGPATTRLYDPAPLLEVVALDVGPRGVVGVTESGPLLDVHHADHTDSRNRRLRNGLSLLPRPHYAALRARFGGHLVDGIAGESVLLDTPSVWDADGPAGTLLLETADGEHLELTDSCRSLRASSSAGGACAVPSGRSTSRCRRRWTLSETGPAATTRARSARAASRPPPVCSGAEPWATARRITSRSAAGSSRPEAGRRGGSGALRAGRVVRWSR
jgi:hypothetical protein